MTVIRDFFRRRRISRHVAQHGYVFDFHGLTVRIPQDSPPGVGNALLRQKYEMEEAQLILRHLDPGLPVIELGGSIGVISCLIQSRLAAGVRHLVVEANPALIDICRQNASQQPDGGAEVINAALGYGATHLAFTIGANIHSNRLAQPGDKGERVIQVPAVTLSDLLSCLGDVAAYTLVCDIEGGELDLLENEWEQVRKAALVIMELHPNVYPKTTADVQAIEKRMQDAGFQQAERLGDVFLWRR